MERQFENVEQRMVTTYLDTYPLFVSAEDGPRTTAPAQFYDFMKGLYQLLAEEPMLLGLRELHEDDAHPWRFNNAAYGKPELKGWMMRVIKQADALLAAIFAMGEAVRLDGDGLVIDATVKLSRKYRLLLEALGLEVSAGPDGTIVRHDGHPELFAAWTWMATRPGASMLDFSRCFFRQGHPYARDIYRRLSGNEAACDRLEAYLLENGYTRMDNWDGRQLWIDYWKSQDGEAPTKFGFEFGFSHIGVAAMYSLWAEEPPVFGLCIPRMKETLSGFRDLPSEVQSFVVNQTHKCNGCRYCVQLDKTGTRPLVNIPVSHGGKTYRLCPYFPGYSYHWPELSDTLADNMVAMLGAMDRLFGGPPVLGA